MNDPREERDAHSLWKENPESVGEYLGSVRAIRKHWELPEHKELWFRGEDGEYSETKLCPKLYRPPGKHPVKPISRFVGH